MNKNINRNWHQKTWPRVPLPVWFLVAASLWLVLQDFHVAMRLASPQQAPIAGYAFPVVVGVVLSLRIMPQYRWGFVWAGLLANLIAILISAFKQVPTVPATYTVVVSLFLLFYTQAAVLGLRYAIAQRNNPPSSKT